MGKAVVELYAGALDGPELMGSDKAQVLTRLDTNARYAQEICVLAENLLDAGWRLEEIALRRDDDYCDITYCFAKDGLGSAQEVEGELRELCGPEPLEVPANYYWRGEGSEKVVASVWDLFPA